MRMLGSYLMLALGMFPFAVLAQQSPTREALKQSCTGDYLAHCSQFPPGGPEVEACFRVKLKQLSLGYSAAISAYKRDQKSMRRVSVAR